MHEYVLCKFVFFDWLFGELICLIWFVTLIFWTNVLATLLKCSSDAPTFAFFTWATQSITQQIRAKIIIAYISSERSSLARSSLAHSEMHCNFATCTSACWFDANLPQIVLCASSLVDCEFTRSRMLIEKFLFLCVKDACWNHHNIAACSQRGWIKYFVKAPLSQQSIFMIYFAKTKRESQIIQM